MGPQRQRRFESDLSCKGSFSVAGIKGTRSHSPRQPHPNVIVKGKTTPQVGALSVRAKVSIGFSCSLDTVVKHCVSRAKAARQRLMSTFGLHLLSSSRQRALLKPAQSLPTLLLLPRILPRCARSALTAFRGALRRIGSLQQLFLRSKLLLHRRLRSGLLMWMLQPSV